MKKIVVLIGAKNGNIKNWGGGRGLIWEIVNEIKKKNNVSIIYHEFTSNKYVDIYHQYSGEYHTYLKKDFTDVDIILVYPLKLAFYIDPEWRNKIIAIGPDSLSLNAASLLRATKGFFHRNLVRRCFFLFSKYAEYRFLKSIKRLVVVGRTDQLYARRNFFLNSDVNLKKKIFFLHHPLLSKVIIKDICKRNYGKRRMIFSGDLVRKYHEQFVEKMVLELNMILNNTDMYIKIVGKNNKWIYDLLSSNTRCKVEYDAWIDDYNEICHPGEDVHCFPLYSGSGTKNRTLTALANGLEVITTPIGIENIKYNRVKGLYIERNPQKFARKMIEVYKRCDENYIKSIKENRDEFKKRTQTIFYNELSKIIND